MLQRQPLTPLVQRPARSDLDASFDAAHGAAFLASIMGFIVNDANKLRATTTSNITSPRR